MQIVELPLSYLFSGGLILSYLLPLSLDVDTSYDIPMLTILILWLRWILQDSQLHSKKNCCAHILVIESPPRLFLHSCMIPFSRLPKSFLSIDTRNHPTFPKTSAFFKYRHINHHFSIYSSRLVHFLLQLSSPPFNAYNSLIPRSSLCYLMYSKDKTFNLKHDHFTTHKSHAFFVTMDPLNNLFTANHPFIGLTKDNQKICISTNN